MNSFSIRAYKFRMYLHSFLSRIEAWGNSNESNSGYEDEKRLDAVLHYPLKTASIPIVSIDTLLSRQKDKIRIIERDIGLIHKGCEFNFVDLVERTIKAYIGYCHLIPASEMDHHQYIGGLLEHSLDVSIRSLQFSMGFMLDEMGLIDEDQARRPRYEFAAWVCGLLHDSGKIISNVKVVGSNGDVWRPLNESIYDWAKRNSITEYTVIHQKDRLNNDHETNSVHFLPLVLNDVAKNYLLGSHDDLYSMITQTLVHYHSYKGYLFNAVRKADSESTYDDYARVWLHDSSRKKSLTMGVVNAMRSLYSNWVINKVGGDLFVFNGQIFIASDRPINDVIKKCLDYEIKLPTSSKALISILLDKRILSMVSDKSTYANLYLGEYTESDVNQFISQKSGPMSKVSPITVILVEWPNFVIGDNPLPSNVYGALRYNTSKNINVHHLCNREGLTYVIPSSDQSNNAEPNTALQAPMPIGRDTSAENENSIKPSPKAAKPKAAKPKESGAKSDYIRSSKPKAKEKSNNQQNKVSELQTPLELGRSNDSNVKGSSEPTDSNLLYPWIRKTRRPKPIDDALSRLLQTLDVEYIWEEDDSICVNIQFLTDATGQNASQILNAMSFLKLMKQNQSQKDLSQKIINGEKVTYVLLDAETETSFKDAIIKQNNECDKNAISKAPKKKKVSPRLQAPAEAETNLITLKSDIQQGDALASDSNKMTYEELIAHLLSVNPTLKKTQLRNFCKSEGVTPIVSDSGEITIELSSVQLDELKWKLRDSNAESQ